MLTPVYKLWIVYRESDAANVAICRSYLAAEQWINEYVPADDREDYLIEAIDVFD